MLNAVNVARCHGRRLVGSVSVRKGSRALAVAPSVKLHPTWPDASFTFEPAWETSSLPSTLSNVLNAFETTFRLREVQQLWAEREPRLESIDDINMHFMNQFVLFHSEVARDQGRRSKQGPPQPTRGRPEVAAVGARKTWMAERPRGVAVWEMTPQTCKVVQAREAEHHDRGWLQVTTLVAAEERWEARGGNGGSRWRQHYIVFERPREVGAHDFRVADIRVDVSFE